MYFICSYCGKYSDDGCSTKKICANCILNSCDAGSSAIKEIQNAQNELKYDNKQSQALYLNRSTL